MRGRLERDLMGQYYVLYDGADTLLFASWRRAREVQRRTRCCLRGFATRAEASVFVEALARFAARTAAAREECLLSLRADGSGGCGVSLSFGEGDARNAEGLPPPGPRTPARAWLWGALEAARRAPGVRVATPSELVFRAFAEDFPTTFAHQDLMRQFPRGAGGCKWLHAGETSARSLAEARGEEAGRRVPPRGAL
jgi:hypothetical protein